ncbi:MAG: molybdopterin cofactor-binding domain-containing protein [Granulosicoccaceae bacterium]
MKITRRGLLISGAAVGGGLLLGVAGVAGHLATHDRLAHQRKSQSGTAGRPLNLWIRITPDNQVVLLVPHTEMGQGSQTGLAQIVAEELQVDWQQMHVELAPAEGAFANGSSLEPFVREAMTPPDWAEKMFVNGLHRIADLMGMQMTGGSTAVRGTGWLAMRSAAATGRALLVQAAAERWGVGADSLRTESGFVFNSVDGQKLSYGELVDSAAQLDAPEHVAFTDPADYRLIGQSVPRIDVEDKVKVKAVYGIDAAVPQMKYAAVALAPTIGAEVSSIDNVEEIKQRRGVFGVYIVDKGVAVIADNPWRAEQAVRAVNFSTKPHTNDNLNSETLEAEQRSALAGELDTSLAHGDVGLAEADAGKQVSAEYFVPYLAHATLEPMNATVWEEGGKLHVKAGVQNPLLARKAAAKAAGLELDEVVLHPCTMGGGFGRRVAFGITDDPLDWLYQAIQIHQASGEAVKMTWSRETDTRSDVYRPMVLGQFSAGLQDNGKPKYWSGSTYLPNDNAHAAAPPYNIPNLRVACAGAAQAVPTGFWRSVEFSQHGFFVESFIDELALAAGADPLAYRLSLLDADGPQARTLKAVAEMAGWRAAPDAQGRAMGVAVVSSFGSTVAQIAEVSREAGAVRVHRVWAAVDCGVPVNPASIRGQVAGGVHFGLSAALYGKCDINNGAVVQSNFHDYPMVKMADAPEVEVAVLQSDETVGGIGEVGVPPVAAAVCNALALLEERTRRLPIMA